MTDGDPSRRPTAAAALSTVREIKAGLTLDELNASVYNEPLARAPGDPIIFLD